MEDEEDPFFLNLHIRVATGQVKEFLLRVEVTATIDQFKQQIRNHLRVDGRQNLRLIFNGKLLGPDSCTVESTELKNNSYVHAVFSPKPASPSNATSITTSANQTESVVDDRGLNSLMRGVENDPRQRLTQEEVSALRAYFTPSIQSYAERHLTQGESESEEDFRFRAETEWMAAQPPHSEFRFNLNIAATQALFRSTAGGGGRNALMFFRFDDSSRVSDEQEVPNRSQELGTMREFFFGMSLGYVLGFMMIFCVWDANVTYRQKLGILAGIILNYFVMFVLRNSGFENSSKLNESSSFSSSPADTMVSATQNGYLRGSS